MNYLNSPINFNKSTILRTCRICLKKSGNWSIFSLYDDNNIQELIETYSGIKVDVEENMPKCLCVDCLKDLINTHHFITKCKASANILRTLKCMWGLKLPKGFKVVELDVDALKSETESEINFEQYLTNKIEDISQQLPVAEYESQIEECPMDKMEITNNDLSVTKSEIQNESEVEECSSEEVEGISNELPRSIFKNKIGPEYALSNNEDDADELTDSEMESSNTLLEDQHAVYELELSDEDNEKLNNCHTEEVVNYEEHCLEIASEYKDLLSDRETVDKSKVFNHSKKNDVKYKICGFCSKAFRNKAHLAIHMRTHTQEKPFECNICFLRFAKNGTLFTHMRTHTQEKPYECNTCFLRFATTGNLQRHKLVHTGEKPFVCDICGKAVTQSSSLKKHKQIHAGIKQLQPKKNVLCSYCGLCFTTNYKFKRHLLDEHGYLNHENVLTNGEQVLNKEYISSDDSKTFKAYRKCAKQLTDEYDNVSDKKIKSYTCGVCGHSSLEKTYLARHMKTHSMSRTFLCYSCGKTFKSKNSLDTHMIIHQGSRPFKCEFCGKRFTQRSAVVSHTYIHTGVRPYKCKMCDKAFKISGQLAYHMLTHTGEKRHACPHCGKRFSLKGNMTKHLPVHSSVTPYKCPHCGRGYKISKSLRKHLKIHEKKESKLSLEIGAKSNNGSFS